MSEFAIANVLPGKLNALVKNLMDQMKITDPNEAVRRFNAGEWAVQAIKRIIDMDADPFVPKGLELVSHQKQGQLEFDPQRIKLFLAEDQKNGNWMNGKKLQPEVDAQNPYNANLLDWYLVQENQKFIPQEWRGTAVFFWATIYRDSGGFLCVRGLSVLDGGSCGASYLWIDFDFCDGNPAAVAGKSVLGA